MNNFFGRIDNHPKAQKMLEMAMLINNIRII